MCCVGAPDHPEPHGDAARLPGHAPRHAHLVARPGHVPEQVRVLAHEPEQPRHPALSLPPLVTRLMLEQVGNDVERPAPVIIMSVR